MSPAGHSQNQAAMQLWCEEIEVRAAGGKQGVTRGVRRSSRRTAPGAWFCEGRWQHDDQMDIWQCIDQVELDRRAAGIDPDPDDDIDD